MAAKKAGKASGAIEIPAPDIRILKVKVIGDSPLVVRRFSEKAKEEIERKHAQEVKAPRGKRDPKAEYEASMHRMPNGKPGIKANAFKLAMVRACTFCHGIPMTFATGAFFVMGDLLEIKGKPRMHTAYVRVPPRTGGADIRYRAEFPEWSCELLIRYNAHIISPAQIINLLAVAGFSVGVGEGRPEKKLAWGMFHPEMKG